MLDTFAPEHQAFVRWHQPFHAPHPDQHMLAVLAELSNRDKHSLRLGLVAGVDTNNLRVGAGEFDVVTFTFLAYGALTDGDVVMRFTVRAGASGTAAIEATAGLLVGMDVAPRRGIVDALEWIYSHIRYGMIDAYSQYGVMPDASFYQ